MPNVNKQSYALTVLTPIITGRTAGVVHATELRSVLWRINALPESPFAKIAGTHFGRWSILDDVPPFGYPTHSDQLQSKYLMLEADFDGDRDAWIDAMLTVAPRAVSDIYAHCVQSPDVIDRLAFRNYLVAAQLDTTLQFSPFSANSLPSVLRALDNQRKFVGFARAVQGKTNAELRAAFTDFVRKMHDATLPRPGSI